MIHLASSADTLFNLAGFEISDIDPDQTVPKKLNWIELHGKA